jgi:HTH-type transcriptional regulator/antitoxin HigA
MDPPDPIEAIKFRMSQQKLTRKQLEPMIGTRTRVAEVLNRRRSLSISMIRRLHSTLGISAEVLIQPSRTATAGKRQIAR